MVYVCCFFFFKQKTSYEMRISDWSSDVCSSDLRTLSQAQRLVAIAFDGIGLPLGRIADKMMRLTLHRTKARHLPHEPLLSLAAAARVFGKQPAALFGEIEQDRAALEHRQRRTAAYGLMVDDRGQAAVGVDPPIFGGDRRVGQEGVSTGNSRWSPNP